MKHTNEQLNVNPDGELGNSREQITSATGEQIVFTNQPQPKVTSRQWDPTFGAFDTHTVLKKSNVTFIVTE